MSNKTLEMNWNDSLENVEHSGSAFQRAKQKHRGMNMSEIIARQGVLEHHIRALNQCATLIQGRNDVDTDNLKQWS